MTTPAVVPSLSITRAKCTRDRRIESSRSSSERLAGHHQHPAQQAGAASGRGRQGRDEQQEVLGVHEAEHVVEPVRADHRQAGVALVEHHRLGVGGGGAWRRWSRSGRGAPSPRPTSRPPKSSTPESSSAANPWMVPSSREAATSTASSSAVWALASSSRGSTPQSLTPSVAQDGEDA